MSVEELRRQFEYFSNSLGIRNINCGILRRIGKTQCLKEMIRQFRISSPSSHIFLIIADHFRRGCYNDISKITNIIFLNELNNSRMSLLVRSREDLFFFADEVPDAQSILEHFDCRYNVHFIAGFYSEIQNQNEQLIQNEQYNRLQATNRRINIQMFPEFDMNEFENSKCSICGNETGNCQHLNPDKKTTLTKVKTTLTKVKFIQKMLKNE